MFADSQYNFRAYNLLDIFGGNFLMAGLQASLGTHRGYLNKLILIVPAVPTEILGHIYPVKTNIYKYYSISQSFTTFLDLPPRCTIKYFADLLNIFFYYFFLNRSFFSIFRLRWGKGC